MALNKMLMSDIPALTELRQDPYPTYARLRTEAPVFYSEADQAWLISRYESVLQVMRASSEFSNRHSGLERTLVGSSGGKHIESRRTLQPAFSSESLALIEPIIRESARCSVQAALEQRSIEAIGSLAIPVPGAVFSSLLGAPAVNGATLLGWSSGITVHSMADLSSNHTRPDQRALRFFKRLKKLALDPSYSFYREARFFIERHFKSALETGSGTTLTMALLSHHVSGAISWNELTAIGLEFAFAATETTTGLIGSTIRILAEDPELQHRLREDSSLHDLFIEEVLRFTSPIQYLKRVAEEEVVVDGVTIPPSSKIRVLIGSANRDEGIFASASTFNPNRSPNPHIAFGAGPHMCPGSKVARLEAKLLLVELLEQTTSFRRLNPEAALLYRGYSGSRGLVSLDLQLA